MDEKRDGMTREIGILKFDTLNKRCTIFDTPGHKNYILEMISAATRLKIRKH